MILNSVNLNSGDKFFLSMTNLEKANLFTSNDIKTMTALKSLKNDVYFNRNNPFIFFNALGLESPKSVKVANMHQIMINSGNATFSFDLSYKLDDEKEITFKYNFNYTPSNKKNERIYSWFSEKIELCKIANKLHELYPFTYNISFDNNLSLLQNLNKIEKHYKHYRHHFEKIANAINDGELDQHFDFWKLKDLTKYFDCIVSEFPFLYLKYVDYGIDYQTFIGIESFIRMNDKNRQITDNALNLMISGKVDEGLKTINNFLEDFKNNYILGEKKELDEFKAKIKEGQEKIKDFIRELADKYGLHESFFRCGWEREFMPIDLKMSVIENITMFKKK